MLRGMDLCGFPPNCTKWINRLPLILGVVLLCGPICFLLANERVRNPVGGGSTKGGFFLVFWKSICVAILPAHPAWGRISCLLGRKPCLLLENEWKHKLVTKKEKLKLKRLPRANGSLFAFLS